jgi:hypothetical protein
MTIVEKRSELLKLIEQLSDTDLNKLYHFSEQSFSDQELTKEELRNKRRKPGTMQGKIWLSDNWDSAEVNEEIARDFYESSIFPQDS